MPASVPNKPGSQRDRAAVACALATHPGSFIATSESSVVSGCSPFKINADLHERCATFGAYSDLYKIYSHWCIPFDYDTVIAAVECHARF